MSDFVICLGISGFPGLRTASVKKAVYLSKTVVSAGARVLVINSEAVYDSAYPNVSLNGSYQGIEFCSILKNVYRKNGFFGRKLQAFFNKVNETRFLLFSRSISKASHAVLFTSGSLSDLVICRMVLLLRRIKLVLVYHELRSDFEYRKKHFFLRMNDRLFDKHFFRLVDGILPISEYLIQHLQHIKNNKPYLKIPALVDVSNYPAEKTAGNFFLFCGSAGFKDTLEFVIRSFERVADPTVKLQLVLSGQKEEVRQRIKASIKKDLVVLQSDISDATLFELYSSARALLIPLKNELRDIARFPQKIAEYACSGNPVISMRFGEIGHYLEDGKSALLCESYDVEQFVAKMDFVMSHPRESAVIGQEGKRIGSEKFNYLSYAAPMQQFLRALAAGNKLKTLNGF